MYQQPVLFPAISNTETWEQTIEIADDQTGDPISLTDDVGNLIYSIYLEISPSQRGGQVYPGSSYYDQGDCDGPTVTADTTNYITNPDVGIISIFIPYTVMQTLDSGKTYDVYLRIIDTAGQDARQLLIGRLPVAYGGRTI